MSHRIVVEDTKSIKPIYGGDDRTVAFFVHGDIARLQQSHIQVDLARLTSEYPWQSSQLVMSHNFVLQKSLSGGFGGARLHHNLPSDTQRENEEQCSAQ